MDQNIIWEEKSNIYSALESKSISTLIFPFLSKNYFWGWKLQEETPFWVTPEFEVERVEENFRSLAIIFHPVIIFYIFYSNDIVTKILL